MIVKTVLFLLYILLGILFAEWIVKGPRFTKDEKLIIYPTMILIWPLGILTAVCVIFYILFTLEIKTGNFRSKTSDCLWTKPTVNNNKRYKKYFKGVSI